MAKLSVRARLGDLGSWHPTIIVDGHVVALPDGGPGDSSRPLLNPLQIFYMEAYGGGWWRRRLRRNDGQIARHPEVQPRYAAAVIGLGQPSVSPRSATSPRVEGRGDGVASQPPETGAQGPVVSSWVPRLARLSDAQLVLLIALVLFSLAAWPLLLVELPPLQDLPNHVASVHILLHPELYPQYVGNGFFKSNSLLTLWLVVTGRHDLFLSARIFTAIVLAMNAIALPLFVLRFVGRRRMLVAMLFVWPLVHPYFVAMGMLNFVLGVALSLILLTALDWQRERATLWRALVVAALGLVLWFAHPFPLAVVIALVGLHVIRRTTWGERLASARALLLPLLPVAVLSLVSAEQHLVKAEHAPSFAAATFAFHNPWEIVAHFWRDVSGALTAWGSMTIVPAVLLPIYAWKNRANRREEQAFFSLVALVALAVAYVGLPQMLSNWWHLNCRLVSFLWAGLALRLPATLSRGVAIVLVLCALAFSAVTGVDYVRLDRDRAAFTAGMDAVPERATLLPLMFKHSRPSEFTASLSHAWAYYTVEKDTSAPLVFAVERSYPITYREFPPVALIPPALDRFAEQNATPAQVCKALRRFPVDSTCVTIWRELWSSFWRLAEPRFSHVLVWAISPESRTIIPESYRRVLAAGALEVYVRRTSRTDGASLRTDASD